MEKLARDLVRRGHLDRDWLADFLVSAGYPDAAQLCDELFPTAARPVAGYLPLLSPSPSVPAPQSLPPFLAEEVANPQEAGVFAARRNELAQLHGFLARMLAGQRQVI